MEKLSYNCSEYVGIGTINPKARLHVVDSTVIFRQPATYLSMRGNAHQFTRTNGLKEMIAGIHDKACISCRACTLQ